jgi:hypothetical protein
MSWDQIVKKVSPYIVKIETPSGSGTGFLVTYNDEKRWCVVATALHVVSQADEWQQPIRITHHDSGHVAFLKESNRVVYADYETDSAGILFERGDFPFPEQPIPLLPLDRPISIGCEVGWLGFPAIDQYTLCFFSGSVSAHRPDRKAYLIDGVAINGVSGGPVLYSTETDGVQIVGTVSAYRANRTTGDVLPGLLISQDVSHFHAVTDKVRSIDEARRKQQELENAKPDKRKT